MSVLDTWTDEDKDTMKTIIDKLAASIDPNKRLSDVLTDAERHWIRALANETLEADGLPITAWKHDEPWGVAV